jgi:hypothetical protein
MAMQSSDSIDPRLQKLLQQLEAVPRDPQVAACRRAEFLAQAESLQQTVPARPRGWLSPLRLRLSMSALTAAVIVLVLVLGGAGVTVYAAQDALPTDPLYAVKILSEDVRVSLAGDSEAQVGLLLDFSNRRTEEIVALGARFDASQSAGGVPVADQVIARQQAQIENALQIAARMDDTGMTRELARVRDNVAQQLQVVETAQVQSPEQAAPTFSRAQTMLGEQHAFAEMGVNDPAAFRARAREQPQNRPPLPTALPTPRIIPATRTLLPRPTDSPLPPPMTLSPRPIGSPTAPTILPTATVRPRATELPVRATIPPTITVRLLPTHWQTPTTIPLTATIASQPTRQPTPLPTNVLPLPTNIPPLPTGVPPLPTVRPTLPLPPPAWTPLRPPPGWTPLLPRPTRWATPRR